MKQIPAPATKVFIVRRAKLFGFAQHRNPINGRVDEQRLLAKISLNLPKLDAALMGNDCAMKYREAKCIPDFQAVPGSERKRLGMSSHESRRVH